MTTWKEIPIRESYEPLVPLGPFSEYPHLGGSSIYFGERVDSPYYPEGLVDSLITHFVRQGVAEKLDRFAHSLPPRIIPWIEDCYRKLGTQKALYDWYSDALKVEYPAWDEKKVTAEAEHFVSIPSYHPARPSPHNTGGSVDLTLAKLPLVRWVERQGLLTLITKIKKRDPEEKHLWKILYLLHMRLLDIHRRFTVLLPMGTLLDEVKPETVANYYEEHPPATPEGQIALRNRRLLRKAMERVGFTQYRWEWWHYNYGNQMWAEESRSRTAIYGAASFSEENKWWENMRRAHHRRQLVWHDGAEITPAGYGKIGFNPFFKEALDFAKNWSLAFSHPSYTQHPKAAIL